ncbi:hypothetical protein AB1286_07710 [Trinickia sp. NRRL B-1857]|uniref:hypothetical protein n=1 Tax=Trinickia sp. NRRL B-1857 TaxID=3162879 RepID=UPI003D2DB419
MRRSRAHDIQSIRYKWSKASEMRRAYIHCSARRRVVYDWLSSLCASTGDIQRLPREQRRTSTEFRLSKLHPAIRIFVSGTTLAASVHYRGRCWDLLKCLENRPGKAPGGWINTMSIPGQQKVYDSVDALWKAEVFDGFRRWFDRALSVEQALILYGTHDGATWAELMPFATPRGLHEMARFPVWQHSPQAVAR